MTLRKETKATLGRRFAFEEDGEEQREAPRNGIDLDINPGRLPPPPEPRGRAAFSPGSGGARAPGPLRSAGPAASSTRIRSPGRAAGHLPRGHRARGLDAGLWAAESSFQRGQQVSQVSRDSGAPRAALSRAPRRGALGAQVPPDHLCQAGPTRRAFGRTAGTLSDSSKDPGPTDSKRPPPNPAIFAGTKLQIPHHDFEFNLPPVKLFMHRFCGGGSQKSRTGREASEKDPPLEEAAASEWLIAAPIGRCPAQLREEDVGAGAGSDMARQRAGPSGGAR
ncbi:hypothetical protein J0S82_002727 [Galemys pyrenaicus]|uniref:Uncharacterized protein n=1 Tax=Galemys pyrenaicus TaxID=202257 RepID=A0A8J5ZQS2_GALPY|nr:hypothetical protein J0S82_002727 [Galemys pyrenaicus]